MVNNVLREQQHCQLICQYMYVIGLKVKFKHFQNLFLDNTANSFYIYWWRVFFLAMFVILQFAFYGMQVEMLIHSSIDMICPHLVVELLSVAG